MMKEKFITRSKYRTGLLRNGQVSNFTFDIEAPRPPEDLVIDIKKFKMNNKHQTRNIEYRIWCFFNVCRQKFDIRYSLFDVHYSKNTHTNLGKIICKNFVKSTNKFSDIIADTFVSPFRRLGVTLIFLFLLFFSSCSAKITTPTTEKDSSSYELIKSLPIEAQFITSDKLAQLYVVTRKNDLIKYDSKGEELFRYTNNTLGELTHVDVTNPFNILLYYPEFLTVLTLNRTLNQSGEFSLFDLNVVDVQAVAMSNDNNIWLYDDVSFQIKKIDRKGEVITASENLSNQFSKVLQPNFILERDNWLYLNDPALGVLIFDTYGQYSKVVDVKGLLNFQVLDDQLVYRKENSLESFHLKSLNTQLIELPKDISKEHQISIQREKLFIKKEKVVEIYKY